MASSRHENNCDHKVLMPQGKTLRAVVTSYALGRQ